MLALTIALIQWVAGNVSSRVKNWLLLVV